jgi:predicted O-methyltransferase YrrM
MNERANAVDDYLEALFVGDDAALDGALARSAAAGLPPIAVSATQGKFLHLLAAATGARRILEIGTLGGYSAIWFARALPPDGRLITLELDPEHAAIARANLAAAGLEARIEVRVGPALASLEALAAQQPAPFDLVFIDADKENNPGYLRYALELTKPGSLIVLDNAIRGGAVADPDPADRAVAGTREALAMMANDARLSATAVQTVGHKGYDGFAIARVV